jgi:hypothetical protein
MEKDLVRTIFAAFFAQKVDGGFTLWKKFTKGKRVSQINFLWILFGLFSRLILMNSMSFPV